MGGKDRNYTVVYRGDFIDAVPDGRWMMIQRGKEFGGGYWFGRAYADCFWLEFERPMPLSSCVEYVVLYDHVAARSHELEDEFKLNDRGRRLWRLCFACYYYLKGNYFRGVYHAKGSEAQINSIQTVDGDAGSLRPGVCEMP